MSGFMFRGNAHLYARGWVAVTGEEGEDVVLAVVARTRDEREVRRVGASVGIPRSLRVSMRCIRLWFGLGENRGTALNY